MHAQEHAYTFVGVGCSWAVVDGDTAVCNPVQGSEECKGWARDCSADLCTDYWNPTAVPQTGWIQ